MRLNDVSFAYDALPVCDRVSFLLPENGVTCLWGPSGCGKTTLLRLLAGLEKPTAGAVEGVERVSMVFQEDRLLPWLTALENVTVTGATEADARAVLTTLGLCEEEMVALPRHLSGGQQRRVALARALAAESDLLLLDEPFNGLDEDTWQNVVPLIAAYAETRPVVLVTHIRPQAESLGAWMVPLTDTPLSGVLTPEKI
ncbi:MAG: ABC transporter ATP-binding protein [Ruminococcaceae bacterium]|nr:ABC transporter ATP-binding protein [Oscillospiraceae bacterium]